MTNTSKSPTYPLLRIAFWKWKAKLNGTTAIRHQKVLSGVKQLAYSAVKSNSIPYCLTNIITIDAIMHNCSVLDISHHLSKVIGTLQDYLL